DACGPGCSDWIAAEGAIEGPAAVERLRELLDSLKERDLPIFFNSRGGSLRAARRIGRLLRERRMAAGVGKTIPEDCRPEGGAKASCRQIMQAKRELRAQWRVDGAACNSACVYAFVGASVRQVRRGARLGVHATAYTADELR